MKRCNVCNTEKPLDDFHKAKRQADGHRRECKACVREYQRRWRNGPKREEILAKARAKDAAYRKTERAAEMTAKRGRQWRERERQKARDARSGRTCQRCGDPIPVDLREGVIFCTRRCAHLASQKRRRPYRREAINESNRRWRANNPETRRAIEARYWKRHPEKMRAKNARGKARRRGQVVETVDPLAIYERDGWICQLCGEGVDSAIASPDPRSASLDHIIPLSRGGVHAEVNCQLAHRSCNSRKGNRLPEELTA